MPFPESLPLEATVERRHLPLVAESTLGLDLRLVLGRRWLALIKDIGDYRDGFCTRYPIAVPDPDDPADAAICAHADTWAIVAAVAGRAVDGAALYAHLTADAANHAYDGVQVDAGDRQALDDAAEPFVAWFPELILQPPADDAWQPPRLEYRFACSGPLGQGAQVLVAESFEGGHLDWHSVDREPADRRARDGRRRSAADDLARRRADSRDVRRHAERALLDVRGRSHEPRRCQRVDHGSRDAAALRVRAGLRQRLVPAALRPAGRVARAGARAERDDGLRRALLDRGRGLGLADDWQRFSLFTLDSTYAGLAADTGFALLPTAQAVQQGEPLEQVALIRDEMANMVWGVERIVPLVHGAGARGAEAARELAAYYQLLLDRRLARPRRRPRRHLPRRSATR